MRNANIQKITSVTYHRNGVGGVGFHVVEFSFLNDGKKEKAIASVFESDDKNFTGYCSVLTYNKGRIEPTNCWRGDVFETELRNFIKSPEGQSMCWPTLYPTPQDYEKFLERVEDNKHPSTLGETGGPSTDYKTIEDLLK